MSSRGGVNTQSEERGRTWGKEVRKKAVKALERWPPDPGLSSGGLKKSRPIKRLQKATPAKDIREGRGKGGKGLNILERWLQRETQGLEENTAKL